MRALFSFLAKAVIRVRLAIAESDLAFMEARQAAALRAQRVRVRALRRRVGGEHTTLTAEDVRWGAERRAKGVLS